MLVQAAARQNEMAIRAALGADRRRLFRQLLAESLLLAVLGGGAGLLIAAWGIDLLLALSPGHIPRLHKIGVDGNVLGFTLLVSLRPGFFLGLARAVRVPHVDLNRSLKEGGRHSARFRFRSVLVVSEIALTLVLLVGSGLLIRSFRRLLDVNPGFATENLL